MIRTRLRLLHFQRWPEMDALIPSSRSTSSQLSPKNAWNETLMSLLWTRIDHTIKLVAFLAQSSRHWPLINCVDNYYQYFCWFRVAFQIEGKLCIGRFCFDWCLCFNYLSSLGDSLTFARSRMIIVHKSNFRRHVLTSSSIKRAASLFLTKPSHLFVQSKGFHHSFSFWLFSRHVWHWNCNDH